MKKRTRKSVPWAGWSKEAPKGIQRRDMFYKCGKKCFLGKSIKADKQSPKFPICKKRTCKISDKGLYAAYIRARQWSSRKSILKGNEDPEKRRRTYKKIANKSKKMLRKRGYKVGKK